MPKAESLRHKTSLELWKFDLKTVNPNSRVCEKDPSPGNSKVVIGP